MCVLSDNNNALGGTMTEEQAEYKVIKLIPAWECPGCNKLIEELPDAIWEVIFDGAKFQCPKCKVNISLSLHTHSSDEGDWSEPQ